MTRSTFGGPTRSVLDVFARARAPEGGAQSAAQSGTQSGAQSTAGGWRQNAARGATVAAALAVGSAAWKLARYYQARHLREALRLADIAQGTFEWLTREKSQRALTEPEQTFAKEKYKEATEALTAHYNAVESQEEKDEVKAALKILNNTNSGHKSLEPGSEERIKRAQKEFEAWNKRQAFGVGALYSV
jgi:hypothetical protein